MNEQSWAMGVLTLILGCLYFGSNAYQAASKGKTRKERWALAWRYLSGYRCKKHQ